MSFEHRLYYAADLRVNPADPQAVDAMMARRERLLKPLAAMDGLVVIDSDPGGYPEFDEQRVRQSARSAIGACSIAFAPERSSWSTGAGPAGRPTPATTPPASSLGERRSEFLETLTMLKEQNPEPWGLARGLEYAQKLGLQSKVINFSYGAIELEPVFPITNFGRHAGGDAYAAGREMAPRGTQANAQTHCVQLPGTFAFSRGAVVCRWPTPTTSPSPTS